MKAARYYKAKDIRIEDIEEPKIVNDDEVKVKVAWTGICGSDLHEYVGGPGQIDEKDLPITMGHESSGVVKEVGTNVSHVKPGDKVIIKPVITKGKRSDSMVELLADGFTAVGFEVDGGYGEYTVLNKRSIYKVDDDLPLETASLIEPIAVGMQALQNSDFRFGESVAIFGAGPIGLATVIAAKSAGASEIFVFDLSEERLEMAKTIGADYAINSGEQDPVAFVKEKYELGVDRTYEVAGVEQTFNQSIEVTRPHGVVTVVSVFEEPFDFNPMSLTFKGVKLVTSLAYEDEVFELTKTLIETGKIDPTPLITDRIKLDNIVEDGFEELTNNKKQTKILVNINEDLE